ncbi:hypothetical protein [Deinococcus apachensis]|uniref:hypothetical protein n=1 Tax=Deinococcus apachensis TaxID=309886 RepID=UPI00035CC16A|nr:hypothetical protein [Deinococcus apachensis]
MIPGSRPGTGGSGQSDFDIWKAQPGNETKTEADYLEFLRGKPGPRGTQMFYGTTTPANLAAVSGAIAGDTYLNTVTGDLYELGASQVSLRVNLRGPAGAATGAEPRGTGGTIGRITTRAPGTLTRTDLLPSDTADKFDPEYVAFIDVDNKAIRPGEVGRVTGLTMFQAGKRYYVAVPASTGAPNLAQVPDTLPDGWPTANVLNVNTRYYLALRCFSDGTETYVKFMRDATVAEAPNVAAPITVRQLDVAGLPYNTDLVTGGQMVRLLQIGSSGGSNARLLADSDLANASAAPSPIQKDVGGGVMKGVFVRVQPFGFYELWMPAGWPDQVGGEALMEFQTDGTADNAKPSIFFSFSGSAVAGTPGMHLAVQGYNGNFITHKIVTSGNTQSSDTAVGSASGVAWTANELWNMRVKVTSADKKVYARAWKTGSAEPATWGINGVVAADLVLGKWGYRFRNGVSRVTRFALAPEGETATYA